MTRYFELTDTLRQGEMIRQDGRKHYRFSFGPFQWERTTIFQAYITEGTSQFGQYRELQEETAQALLMQRGKEIFRMLEKAEEIARKAHGHQTTRAGQPYIEYVREVADILSDWEEKTVAWLRDVCAHSEWSVAQLSQAGFSRRICQSVDLLTLRANDVYGEYLSRLRKDRIARRVKIAELGYHISSVNEDALTPEEQKRIGKYREARKYLFGDLPTYSDTMELQAADAPRESIVPSQQVYQSVYPLALGGRKIPHGVSNPVLRKKGDQLYLAFFVYPYTRAQLQQGAIGRPISWMLADIQTGELVEELSCGTQDFSSAGEKEMFSVHNPNPPRETDFFRNAYAILDEVRKGYLESGAVDIPLYEAYLSKILLGVPPSYHRFYRELSNP